MDLEECGTCGRRFNPDALTRHMPICAKNAKKRPRKQFNSQKNRIDGTEINYNELKRAEKRKPTVAEQRAAEKKHNWRYKHEEFVRSVRAAKGADTQPDYSSYSGGYSNGGGGGSLYNSGSYEKSNGYDEPTYDSRTYSKPRSTQKTQPPQSYNSPQKSQIPQQRAIPPGYTHCDHCGRNFSDEAADRHIPFCAEQQRKKAIKQGTSAKATAAQKQAIRTQYKPPAPSKSRTKVPSGQSSGYGKATTPSRYSQQALQNQYQNQNQYDNELITPTRKLAPSAGRRAKQNALQSANTRSPSGSAGRRALRKNCADCLTIYPVDWAKYCCECGSKRI